MGAVSRLPLRPCRSGRLGVSFLYALSVYIFSISFPVISFSIFVLILGVAWLRLLHPVNREAVTRTHFFVISMCSLFSLHTLLYLWRGRVVRNDSLIRRLGRQRSGIGVKTVPRPHLPCNRLVLIRNSHVMVLGTS